MNAEVTEFVRKLNLRGYETDENWVTDVVKVVGNGIIGCFSVEYYLEDFYICGCRTFIAENSEVFNKWTDCPMYMPIEDAMSDTDQLFQYLEWLATPEGKNYSAHRDFLDGLLDETQRHTIKLPYVEYKLD